MRSDMCTRKLRAGQIRLDVIRSRNRTAGPPLCLFPAILFSFPERFFDRELRDRSSFTIERKTPKTIYPVANRSVANCFARLVKWILWQSIVIFQSPVNSKRYCHCVACFWHVVTIDQSAETYFKGTYVGECQITKNDDCYVETMIILD